MGNWNRIITQVGAVVTIILGWVNPNGSLDNAAQAALTATAAAVIAVIHLVAAIESAHANGISKSGNADKNGS